MNKPIIDIQNAHVMRGNKKVFQGLNLSITEGERVAVLGPNGSGKTTLVKLITRELYPIATSDSYIALFGDVHVNIWDLREKIGVVSNEFQNRYETLASGLDVVMSAFFGSVGIHGHHHVTEAQKVEALNWMRDFHIADLADAPFLQLSSGQQRRLLLARATIHKPKALILDEPTNSLDVKASFHILSDLQQFADKGVSLLLITHHIQEIIPDIERVILLKHGKIIFDGRKEEALTSKRLSNCFDTSLRVIRENDFYSWVPD